jgi:hypothetical protein
VTKSGVNVYVENPGGRKQIAVFNPDRSPFWLPVTMKELADASLEYFAVFNKIEIDRIIFTQLNQKIAELSFEELAAPAYFSHDSHFVLKANDKDRVCKSWNLTLNTRMKIKKNHRTQPVVFSSILLLYLFLRKLKVKCNCINRRGWSNS